MMHQKNIMKMLTCMMVMSMLILLQGTQTYADDGCSYSGQNLTTPILQATGSLGTYYLNLCTALPTNSDGSCPGNTAICQGRNNEQGQTLGSIGGGVWGTSDGAVDYVIQSPSSQSCDAGSTKVPRIAIVQFVCNSDGDPSMTVDDTTGIKLSGDGPFECTWFFTVQSQAACSVVNNDSPKKSLSGGWIFIIILIVVTALYVFGGIAYMKFRKGASGTDLCPNKEFWKDLPGLVKDGFVYVFSKCRGKGAGEGSYSGI